MGAVDNYKAKMAHFCDREFGTSDLKACKLKMGDEYRDVWG